ncbi:MAG: anti-sigma factor [Alphaproteobacteria bacterium]|nr:anti-sigma factor [Alphaproteobacteria bacterium]
MTDELDQLEALAADYVLGTLDESERRRVRSRLSRDPELARLVQEWTLRLSPVAEALPPVEPPPHVWQRIEAALDETRPAARRESLFERLGFWRWCTAGAAAAAAVLALYVALGPLPTDAPAPPRYVATLSQDPAAPAWLATVDLEARQVLVRPVGQVAGHDGAFELWLIAGAESPPRSLGLLPPSQEVALPISAELAGAISPAAALAVSLEPVGGSPTGLPTGPVVYQAPLIGLDR